jgi:hypothetical protein
MEWLTSLGIPQQFTGLATLIFVSVLAAGAGVARLIGKREGAPQPKVQEFYAAGAISDMGPVKELVEGQGLLYQQQVRTNIALERVAVALETISGEAGRYVTAKLEEIEDHEREEEIERRARIRAEDLIREQEAAREDRRRPTPRKPP